MTYEFRRSGVGPWRPVFPMRGESLDEVFRQLGPGAEVRQAQEAAGEASEADGASGVLDVVRQLGRDVVSLAKQVDRGASLLDGMADRILSAAQRELRQAGRYEALEALEARVSQLEALREMGAPEDGCKHDGLKVGTPGGRFFCVQCGTHVKGGVR